MHLGEGVVSKPHQSSHVVSESDSFCELLNLEPSLPDRALFRLFGKDPDRVLRREKEPHVELVQPIQPNQPDKELLRNEELLRHVRTLFRTDREARTVVAAVRNALAVDESHP